MSDMKNGTFCVSRSKVGHAQKMLRTTLVEYYKGLTLLQNYSSLNMLAFAKILKKYDKVIGKYVMNTYLRAVETSYFSSPDKVVILVEKVEALFTKHFSKNNIREAERETVRRRRRQIRFPRGEGNVGRMQAPR